MHDLLQMVDVPVVHRDHRHDVLRQHVQRIARVPHVFDRARAHTLDHDGAFEQIPAELREHNASTDGVDVVTGAPDALQSRCDRGRRFDLDDQIDEPHVDPELERRRCDDAREPALLEVFFDHHALLARDGAVVRARDLLAGDVVDARAEPLGQPPRVGEDDRAVVRADEVDDPPLYGRPDARALFRVGAGRRDLVEAAHVFNGDHDAEIELLARARLDDRDGAAAAQERGDLVERPDGRRQTDALGRGREQLVQPLERKREVHAALRAGDRMDLVDDDDIDVAEGIARLGRQEEEQRLRGADQDVGRSGQHPAAVLRRRVAGPNPDDDRRQGGPEPGGGRLDAG